MAVFGTFSQGQAGGLANLPQPCARSAGDRISFPVVLFTAHFSHAAATVFDGEVPMWGASQQCRLPGVLSTQTQTICISRRLPSGPGEPGRSGRPGGRWGPLLLSGAVVERAGAPLGPRMPHGSPVCGRPRGRPTEGTRVSA